MDGPSTSSVGWTGFWDVWDCWIPAFAGMTGLVDYYQRMLRIPMTGFPFGLICNGGQWSTMRAGRRQRLGTWGRGGSWKALQGVCYAVRCTSRFRRCGSGNARRYRQSDTRSAYARIFENVARNKSYRALLLDIDSPGGSAAASEALHRSIERVAESKPVVAYVQGIGASGGYYLCCAASQVYALPTALVGSIGVIYLRPVLEQLLGRAGVEFTIFKGASTRI